MAFLAKVSAYLTILLLSITAYAEDVTIITHEFPSKTEKWGENQIGGIAGEIISQAFKTQK